jgi:hypothetical protein
VRASSCRARTTSPGVRPGGTAVPPRLPPVGMAAR